MKFHAFAIGAAACALIGLSQAAPRTITQVATPARTANTQQQATFGLPQAAGLQSAFPAGLTAGSGPVTGAATTTTTTGTTATTSATASSPAAGNVVIQSPTVTQPVATDPAVTTGASVPVATTTVIGGVATTTAVAGGVYAGANVMGAGTNIPNAPQSIAVGPGPYTDVEIARSFLNADANGDGELSRAEATRLLIMPFPFETMDANHDGVVSRSEYQDALR